MQDSIKQLIEKRANEAKDRQRTETLLNYYSGNQLAFRQSFGVETRANLNMRPKFAPNLFRKAITDLSYLYAVNPVRTSAQAETWSKVLWESGIGIDSILYEADALTRVCGTTLAVLMPKPDSTLDLYVLPSTKFVAIEKSTDSRSLEAVLVFWNHSWLYIDNTFYIDLSDDKITDDDITEHGLGILPCCTLKNTISSNSIYGEAIGGKDLLPNLQTLNLQFEELTFVSMLQRGQPVIAGKSAKNLVLGVNTPIEVESAGDFQFVQNGANINAMMQGLQMNLDSLAISLGISKRSFNVRSTMDGLSADIIYASQLELAQDRQARERIARIWEKQIHSIASSIYERLSGTKLDIPKVRFVEFSKPLSFNEILEKAKAESDLGLADKHKVTQDLNPQFSQSEIEETLSSAEKQRNEERRVDAVVAGRGKDSEAI